MSVNVNRRVNLSVTGTIRDVQAKLGWVGSQKKELEKNGINVPVDADIKKAEISLDDLRDQLRGLASKVTSFRVDADDKEAVAKLASINAKLVSLDKRTAQPKISITGAARAAAEIASLDLALDKVGGKGGGAALATSSFEGLGASVGRLGNLALPAAIGSLVALSPVAVTAGLGLGGLGLAAFQTAQNADEMSKILDPLQSKVRSFSNSLQPTVLGIFNQGVGLATSLLGDLQPIAQQTGSALGGVMSRIDAAFKSNTWQSFFGFMRDNAGPDIQMLGNLFVDLANDLPPLLEDLQPLASDLLQTADGAAKLAGATANLLGPFSHLLDFFGNPSKLASDAMTQSLRNQGVSINGIAGAAGSAITPLSNTALQSRAIKIAMQQAKAPTDAMVGGLYVINQNAALAASSVGQLNSAWETFIGLSTGLEGAQEGVTQALSNMHQQAKQANATFTGTNDASITLQQTFESSLVPQLQSVIGGMRQAHASSHDMATVVSTDLKPAVDQGALSNKAMAAQIFALAQQAGYTGPNKLKPLKDWIDKNAGSAQNAKNKVDNWSAALAALPKSESLKVHMQGDGKYTIFNATTGAPFPIRAAAAGAFVTGGTPGKDSVPIMAMPGEVVVPTSMVRAGAVDHLRGSIPGFAAGGVVGSLTPKFINSMHPNFLAAMANGITKAVAAGTRQATAMSVPNVGSGVSRWASVVSQALRLVGLSQALSGRVLYQMQTESGGNPNAVNLTDINAAHGDPSRGLMQVIGATFGSYHVAGTSWNILDPLANIAAALNYGKYRYGPTLMRGGMGIGSGHGYDRGGVLPPGFTMAYNGTGHNEYVVNPALSRGGGDVHYHINVTAAPMTHPRDIGREVVSAIQAYEKGSGKGWRS